MMGFASLYPSYKLLDCFAPLAMTSNELIEQIAPGRIRRLYQSELLLSRPTFDLFFTGDGVRHRRMQLVPDKDLAAILRCEAADDAFAILPRALREIRSHPCIERTVSAACHDVNGRLSHHRGPSQCRHCEERSDEAIQSIPRSWIGMPSRGW